MCNKLIVLLALLGLLGPLAMGAPTAMATDDLLEAESSVEAINRKPETFEYHLKREESSAAGDEDASEKSALDKVKTIAFNSREVRLVGPNQKEVEMKDDMGTKMMIALDNITKEAGEVWGQVSDKVDKGWTDFKQMVEGVVSPSTANKKNYVIV